MAVRAESDLAYQAISAIWQVANKCELEGAHEDAEQMRKSASLLTDRFTALEEDVVRWRGLARLHYLPMPCPVPGCGHRVSYYRERQQVVCEGCGTKWTGAPS